MKGITLSATGATMQPLRRVGKDIGVTFYFPTDKLDTAILGQLAIMGLMEDATFAIVVGMDVEVPDGE